MVVRSPALRRRRLAATIGVAWLLAVLILPALHLGHHDAAHEHRADGTIVTVTVTSGDAPAHAHAHGPGAAPHRHHGPADDDTDDDDAPRRDPVRPAVAPVQVAHAAAGAAHLGLALLEPPPPVIPACATAAPLRPLPPPPIEPDGAPATRPRARAPPR